MCNAYKIGPDASQAAGMGEEFLAAVAALSRMPLRLIRRTAPGPVLIGGQLVEARWGFRRPWGDVNNTRSDNLNSRTWAKAIEGHRCLVPMSGFYEFTGPAGNKVAHEFSRRGGGYLWIAGVWEDDPVHGRCYSTLTTEPGPIMEPIHDRQLAVLTDQQLEPYLEGVWTPAVQPDPAVDGLLAVQVVANPLKRKPDPPPPPAVQGELF